MPPYCTKMRPQLKFCRTADCCGHGVFSVGSGGALSAVVNSVAKPLDICGLLNQLIDG
jgi:hypothetical protein